MWAFDPSNYKPGDMVSGGDILGHVYENALFRRHDILTPPKISGRVVEMQPKGQYNVS